MRYFVSWIVNGSRPTGCPDFKPDPYTGEFPKTHCLVDHFESFTTKKTRGFDSEEEAKQFIENAPIGCTDFTIETFDETL